MAFSALNSSRVDRSSWWILYHYCTLWETKLAASFTVNLTNNLIYQADLFQLTNNTVVQDRLVTQLGLSGFNLLCFKPMTKYCICQLYKTNSSLWIMWIFVFGVFLVGYGNIIWQYNNTNYPRLLAGNTSAALRDRDECQFDPSRVLTICKLEHVDMFPSLCFPSLLPAGVMISKNQRAPCLSKTSAFPSTRSLWVR